MEIDSELLRDYKDLKIKDSFKVMDISKNSLIVSGYGGASGTNWLYSIRIGKREKRIIKFDSFERSFNNDETTMLILNSVQRNNYVYFYDSNEKSFWNYKKWFFIIRIVSIIVLFILFCSQAT